MFYQRLRTDIACNIFMAHTPPPLEPWGVTESKESSTLYFNILLLNNFLLHHKNCVEGNSSLNNYVYANIEINKLF